MVGVGSGTVQRVKREMVDQLAKAARRKSYRAQDRESAVPACLPQAFDHVFVCRPRGARSSADHDGDKRAPGDRCSKAPLTQVFRLYPTTIGVVEEPIGRRLGRRCSHDCQLTIAAVIR